MNPCTALVDCAEKPTLLWLCLYDEPTLSITTAEVCLDNQTTAFYSTQLTTKKAGSKASKEASNLIVSLVEEKVEAGFTAALPVGFSESFFVQGVVQGFKEGPKLTRGSLITLRSPIYFIETPIGEVEAVQEGNSYERQVAFTNAEGMVGKSVKVRVSFEPFESPVIRASVPRQE